MKNLDWVKIMGWTAVLISTAAACFWAFWGIIENFHEGWYSRSLLMNLGLMVAQYMAFMLIFMGIALVSIFWPRVGAGLHIFIALFALWFFNAGSNAAIFFLIIPLVGLALLYWFGRPEPRRLAVYVAVGLPLLTAVIFGVEPIIRVSQRINDGNFNARLVSGNEVELIWAPEGPGWPLQGDDWYTARETCEHLVEDGTALADTPQNIWRLPTADEAVRSMARHGENCGGQWDEQTAQATYQMRPDKETPLWNIYSQVIYWWTESDVNEDEERAYIIVYDGKVWPRAKDFGPDYLGFRCVKPPSA